MLLFNLLIAIITTTFEKIQGLPEPIVHLKARDIQYTLFSVDPDACVLYCVLVSADGLHVLKKCRRDGRALVQYALRDSAPVQRAAAAAAAAKPAAPAAPPVRARAIPRGLLLLRQCAALLSSPHCRSHHSHSIFVRTFHLHHVTCGCERSAEVTLEPRHDHELQTWQVGQLGELLRRRARENAEAAGSGGATRCSAPLCSLLLCTCTRAFSVSS